MTDLSTRGIARQRRRMTADMGYSTYPVLYVQTPGGLREAEPDEVPGAARTADLLRLLDEARARIERLEARVVRLDSGLRESAEARHAIGHLRQEVTGDLITFEECPRAGCASARAALTEEVH